MKKIFLILLMIVSFSTSVSCQNRAITYLGNKEMGAISAYSLSINNNGDQAIVEFRQDKGLWIIGKDFNKKIADAPATMGTWSPSNKLIAYINGKKLIIVDKDGNIQRELDLGLRWVDSTDLRKMTTGATNNRKLVIGRIEYAARKFGAK